MKNHISILKYITGLALMLGVVMSACRCSDEEITNYIKLSDNAFTFDAAGKSKLSIDIQTDVEKLIVALGADWLSIESQTENNIVIVANINVSDKERSTTITFAGNGAREVVNIIQMSANSGVPNTNGNLAIFRPFYTQDGINGGDYTTISTNGRYVVTSKWKWTNEGSYSDRDNFFLMYDTATDEEIILGPFSKDLGYAQAIISPIGVTDEGVVFYNSNNEFLTVDKYNVSNAIELSGYSDIKVSDVVGNGTWIGVADNGSETVGVKVTKEGVVTLIEGMEVDIWGVNRNVTTNLVGLSGDGSKMYGIAQFPMPEINSNWSTVIYWDESGSPRYAGDSETIYAYEKDGGAVYLNAPSAAKIYRGLMSYSGRYIAHMYGKYPHPDYYVDLTETRFPWIYDTQTKETHIYPEYNNGARFLTITDSGIAATSDGHVIDMNTGARYNSKDWIFVNYGIKFEENPVIWKFAENGNFVGSLDSQWEGLSFTNTFAVYYPGN